MSASVPRSATLSDASLPQRIALADVVPIERGQRTGAAFLSAGALCGHAVQFYEDEAFLADAVSEYLAAGLCAGDRLLVIATPARRDLFAARLDPARLQAASSAGSVKWIDADQTLASFMRDGLPDPALFQQALARALQFDDGAANGDRRRLRAYGEMVDLLWKRGTQNAALRLEELWNQAARAHEFSLLCAYGLNNFGSEADSRGFLEVCQNHSHVIPSDGFSRLDDDDARLREISSLQQRGKALEREVQQRKELERSLRIALAEREQVAHELRISVALEREARQKAEASDSFKQVFLGMLGHDLRNPLSTILTTTRMMMLRRELPAESHKRIERVFSSAERMRRMIEQILDVTRVRLASGIPLRISGEQDLTARVLKIVDELRSAHPRRKIVFLPELRYRACVDGDRFEQVVSNLVGNAITHGDPLRPITVGLDAGATERSVRLSVHNHGPAIDPGFLPLLFDPFERGGAPMGHSDGLGLGLYISKCIIEAHGGSIDVRSSIESGTRFEVVLPRA